MVANSPFDMGSASSGGAGGGAALAITLGVRGADGARTVLGFRDVDDFGAAARLALAAALFLAAALRAGEDGLARPDRPRRWTLPITALRVTPPNCLAICDAERPSAQSFVNVATRSSVQAIANLLTSRKQVEVRELSRFFDLYFFWGRTPPSLSLTVRPSEVFTR